MHAPTLRAEEIAAAEAALRGESQLLTEKLTNIDRCVGIAAAGYIARAKGDLGLAEGKVAMSHTGAAGHYYGAYLVNGMDLRLTGSVADSAFTAAYGGTLVVRQPEGQTGLTVVGNAFGYGARGGTAFIAGRAGNRFGVCFRKNPEGGGPTVVVEGVESNAFQYMTGGVAVVLGPTGFNLGAGMTGGKVYLMDADLSTLNPDYVHAVALEESDLQVVTELIQRHADETGSKVAVQALKKVSPQHFVKVVTKLLPESLE
jgi:glutamate synthase domain-containing protein 3